MKKLVFFGLLLTALLSFVGLRSLYYSDGIVSGYWIGYIGAYHDRYGNYVLHWWGDKNRTYPAAIYWDSEDKKIRAQTYGPKQ